MDCSLDSGRPSDEICSIDDSQPTPLDSSTYEETPTASLGKTEAEGVQNALDAERESGDDGQGVKCPSDLMIKMTLTHMTGNQRERLHEFADLTAVQKSSQFYNKMHRVSLKQKKDTLEQPPPTTVRYNDRNLLAYTSEEMNSPFVRLAAFLEEVHYRGDRDDRANNTNIYQSLRRKKWFTEWHDPLCSDWKILDGDDLEMKGVGASIVADRGAGREQPDTARDEDEQWKFIHARLCAVHNTKFGAMVCNLALMDARYILRAEFPESTHQE